MTRQDERKKEEEGDRTCTLGRLKGGEFLPPVKPCHWWGDEQGRKGSFRGSKGARQLASGKQAMVFPVVSDVMNVRVGL